MNKYLRKKGGNIFEDMRMKLEKTAKVKEQRNATTKEGDGERRGARKTKNVNKASDRT